MSAGHLPMAEAVKSGLVTPTTQAEVRRRYPDHELLLTLPAATAGGWYRAWGRKPRKGGGWERVNAPWVSHDPERAARALLGERPAEYDR